MALKIKNGFSENQLEALNNLSGSYEITVDGATAMFEIPVADETKFLVVPSNQSEKDFNFYQKYYSDQIVEAQNKLKVIEELNNLGFYDEIGK